MSNIQEAIQELRDVLNIDDRLVTLDDRLAALETWRDAMCVLHGDPTKPAPKGVINMSGDDPHREGTG